MSLMKEAPWNMRMYPDIPMNAYSSQQQPMMMPGYPMTSGPMPQSYASQEFPPQLPTYEASEIISLKQALAQSMQLAADIGAQSEETKREMTATLTATQEALDSKKRQRHQRELLRLATMNDKEFYAQDQQVADE